MNAKMYSLIMKMKKTSFICNDWRKNKHYICIQDETEELKIINQINST